MTIEKCMRLAEDYAFKNRIPAEYEHQITSAHVARAALESGLRKLVEEVRAETQDHNFAERKESRMESGMIGKYVIVRCRDAGVHAGVLKAHEGREARLSESRRLWYWKPANGKKFLSGVASAGLDATSKVGTAIDVLLTETCEIILCTEVAEKSIRGIKDDDR